MGSVVVQELRIPFCFTMALPVYKGIFPHRFVAEYQNAPSVYKMWVGDHYFIWKCRAIINSMYHMGGDIERKIRRGCREDYALYKLVSHIASSRAQEIVVEAIIQSQDPLLLLKTEYDLLVSSETDPKCLNLKFTPHIPSWMPPEAHDFLKHIKK